LTTKITLCHSTFVIFHTWFVTPNCRLLTLEYFRHFVFYINPFLKRSPYCEIGSEIRDSLQLFPRIHGAHAITLFHVHDGATVFPIYSIQKHARHRPHEKHSTCPPHRRETRSPTRQRVFHADACFHIYVTRASMLLTVAGQ